MRQEYNIDNRLYSAFSCVDIPYSNPTILKTTRILFIGYYRQQLGKELKYSKQKLILIGKMVVVDYS